MPQRSPKGSSVSPDDQNRVLLPARRPQHLNATDHFFLDNHRSAAITCTRTGNVHLHGQPKSSGALEYFLVQPGHIPADGFLNKPIDFEHLKQCIQAITPEGPRL